MRTLSGNEVSRIGIGTWGVGGRGHRNISVTDKLEDKLYVDALRYSLEQGMNFTEVSLGYGHGEALRLLAEALRATDMAREDIFITHSLYTVDLDRIETIENDIDSFYHVLDTSYADSTLVTQSAIIKFGTEAIYLILDALLASGKTRYVSLSNASPTWIRRFKEKYDDKFYAHEGHLSFEVRILQDKGVLSLCDELHVQNIIWRPIRKAQSMAQAWPLLVELAEKYDRTQSQIILNWMCALGYKPMLFSTNKHHIDENLAALGFRMSPDDLVRITKIRPASISIEEVDWEGLNIDSDIVGLANNLHL